MTAYNYRSLPRTPVQDAPLAVQSVPADLLEPPRAQSMDQDQVNFVTVEIAEIISQPVTRAPPAPTDSQEGQGCPWEYGVTLPLRATMLFVVPNFLSLCLYLAVRAYVSHA
ncbi:hypothetical protein EDD21DRAFT_349404 [Dissophora ornata]|nr:hypothetical protein EDD21DRAFT_349404 [Dissophora ornata]